MDRFISNKKGFTVIELVIVIGVIGILSGILIPTFINVSEKAKQASDKALVKNLNTALRIGDIDNKVVTCHDAIEVVEKSGFDPSNIVTKGRGDIVWDSITHDFVLVEDVNELDSPSKYFSFYTLIPSLDEQNYSIYVADDSIELNDLDIKVGFDSGDNTSLGTLNYLHDGDRQEVIIRTNNKDSNVVVDAPNDTVHHYGQANYVTINKISTSSYFEFGETSFTTINEGRLVLTNSSDIGGVYLKGNDAIIAKEKDVLLPKVSRDSSVVSTTIQTVDEKGFKQDESSVSISEAGVSIDGNVDTSFSEEIKKDLSTSSNEFTSRMESKYVARVGDVVEGQEDNYYETFQEAVDSIASITNETKIIYLLKDLEVSETITLSGTMKYAHKFDLQNYSIKGNGCIPLSIQLAGKAFTVQYGTLIGDDDHPAIEYNTATSSIYLTMTSIDTVGEVSNTSTSTSAYIRLNGGTHTKWSKSGKVVVNVTTSTSVYTYFDVDPTDIVNLKRSKVTLVGGLYKVNNVTQSKTNMVACASDNFTRYASIAEAIQYDDYPTISLRLLADVNEDVVTTTTKTISIATGTAIKTSSKAHSFTGSIVTGGSVTLSYGTMFNLSNIECKTFTVSHSAEVVVENATVTALTVSGTSSVVDFNGGKVTGTSTISGTSAVFNFNGGTLAKLTLSGNTSITTIDGGTISSTFKISSSKTVTLNIVDGIIKKTLSLPTTTVHTVNVRGGKYTSSAIRDSYKKLIPTEEQANYDYVKESSYYCIIPKSN